MTALKSDKQRRDRESCVASSGVLHHYPADRKVGSVGIRYRQRSE